MGIEEFSSLETLTITDQSELTSIDMSGSTFLTTLQFNNYVN